MGKIENFFKKKTNDSFGRARLVRTSKIQKTSFCGRDFQKTFVLRTVTTEKRHSADTPT
jgi:hypothetical protein